MNNGRNDYMRVKDLKSILAELPDEMLIVMPVVDEDNVNTIFGFRKLRIADQIWFSGMDVSVKETSK